MIKWTTCGKVILEIARSINIADKRVKYDFNLLCMSLKFLMILF